MDPLRDRIFGLLSDLCGSQSELSPDGLRLLSHTLLGVARDHAPAHLFAVRDALPWVAALVEIADGTQSDAVAEMLVSRGAVRALDRQTLSLRLSPATSTRSGGDGLPVEGRAGRVLRDLAALDARLAELELRSDAAIREALLDDPALLGAAASICATGAQTSVARRFREALRLEDVVFELAPLTLWCELEATWDGGALCAVDGFSERTRRFELSASDHLRQSALGPVVRAALLYSGVTAHGGDIRRKLREFSVFAEDRALVELAAAVAENRGRVTEFLGGRLPLRALDTWVRYLRGGCNELAASRDISLREATSYAHFCLHLINFCDLACRVDGAATDAARLAMMEVEDDLRDFAMAGAGLSDSEVHLGRWDSARWEAVTAEEQLLERVARLGGGWRAGFVERGPGGAPRLGADALDAWYDALAGLGYPDEIVRKINAQLRAMSVRGAKLFEVAQPRHALRLLALAANVADGAGVLDFEAAIPWFTDPARRPLAEAMLDLMDARVLLRRWNPSCGFGAERTAQGVAVTVRRHAEFEALLVLLQSRNAAPLMRELARSRIEDLLCVVGDDEVSVFVDTRNDLQPRAGREATL